MQAAMSTPQLLLIASALFLATSVPCSLSAIIRAESDMVDQQIDNDVNALTSSDNDQHDYWRRRLATLLQATPRHLQPVRLQGSDQDTLDYLVPRLTAKYGGGPDDASWVGVRDPRLYVLSEMAPEDDEDNRLLADTSLYNGKFQKRNGVGRNGPSLSIVQPLDVLRQRMLLEIARRKVLEQVKQVEANREYLKSVGKRDVTAQETASDKQQQLKQQHTSRDASAQAQIRNQMSYDESSL